MGRLGAEGSPNIWQSGGSGSRPLPHRLGGARPHEHTRFGHKGARTHGTLESGMMPVPPPRPRVPADPNRPPGQCSRRGAGPQARNSGLRQRHTVAGQKGPKTAFLVAQRRTCGLQSPKDAAEDRPLGTLSGPMPGLARGCTSYFGCFGWTPILGPFTSNRRISGSRAA